MLRFLLPFDFLNRLCQLVQGRRIADQLRAPGRAPPASHAHRARVEPRVMTVDLMQNLIPVFFGGRFPEALAAGHLVETVHHAGGTGPSPLADMRVLRVNEIRGFKAGAGAAGHRAGAAGDAPVVEFLPHGMIFQFVGQIDAVDNGVLHLELVLLRESDPIVRRLGMVKIPLEGFVRNLNVSLFIPKGKSEGMQIRHIRPDAAAEAALKLLFALHQREFHLIPDSFIEEILYAAVLKVNLILNFDGVDVARPAENQKVLLRSLTFPVFVLREVKQGLCNGREDFLHRVGGPFAEFDFIIFMYLPVQDGILLRVPPSGRDPDRGVDIVPFFKLFKERVEGVRSEPIGLGAFQ